MKLKEDIRLEDFLKYTEMLKENILYEGGNQVKCKLELLNKVEDYFIEKSIE